MPSEAKKILANAEDRALEEQVTELSMALLRSCEDNDPKVVLLSTMTVLMGTLKFLGQDGDAGVSVSLATKYGDMLHKLAGELRQQMD